MAQGSMFKHNIKSGCTICIGLGHSRDALVYGDFGISCLCCFQEDLRLIQDFCKMFCGLLSFFWKIITKLNRVL